MKLKSDPRHTARRLALSSIFCWMFTEPDVEACMNLSAELMEDEMRDKDLVDYIVSGVRDNLDKIDNIIQESAPEWPLDKISKIDLGILRISIFELVFGNKTPIRVAIDEAVELSKEFGNDTSHKFVNGVLGTVVDKYCKKENE